MHPFSGYSYTPIPGYVKKIVLSSRLLIVKRLARVVRTNPNHSDKYPA